MKHSLILPIFFILFLASISFATFNSSAYLYVQTINLSTNTTEPLINFPNVFVVNTTDSNLWSATCKNVVITDNQSNPLNYEIDSGCGTGSTVIKVGMNITQNATILIYEGNTGSSGNDNPIAMWKAANATSVWEFNNNLNDVLGNNSLSANGAISYVSNNNDYCRYGTCVNLTTNAFLIANVAKTPVGTEAHTFSAWTMQGGGGGANPVLFSFGAGQTRYFYGIAGMTSMRVEGAASFATTNPDSSGTKIEYFFSRYAGTESGARINGSNNSGSVGAGATTAGNLSIGSGKALDMWSGTGAYIDEARFYGEPKSNNWSKAEYEQNYSDFGTTINNASASLIGVCNSALNTSSAVYRFFDISNLNSINGTLMFNGAITRPDGSTTPLMFSSSNNTVYICITPSNATLYFSGTATYSSTGFTQILDTISNKTFNSTPFSKDVLMTNISSGAYYTFIVQNAYGAIIPNAAITAYRFLSTNSTWVQIQTAMTDSTGSAIFFLVPTQLYNFSVSATGYTPLLFSFTPATTYTIIIQFQQAIPVSPPNWQVINDTSYSITPTSGYYNSSITISYQIANNASQLSSWGMYIYQYNGSNTSLVFSTTNLTTNGGTMNYLAQPNNTYTVYAWFQRNNASNFSISPSFYALRNGSTGLAYVREQLANPLVITGWTYYFIALCISLGIGIVLYKFGSGASAVGALISLWGFTILAPPSMYLFTSYLGTTPLNIVLYIPTFLLTLATLAVLYITSYGV